MYFISVRDSAHFIEKTYRDFVLYSRENFPENSSHGFSIKGFFEKSRKVFEKEIGNIEKFSRIIRERILYREDY